MCILGPRPDCWTLSARYCMVDNLARCEGDSVFSRIGKVVEVECDIKLRHKFEAKLFLSYSFYLKILVWPGEISPRLNAIIHSCHIWGLGPLRVLAVEDGVLLPTFLIGVSRRHYKWILRLYMLSWIMHSVVLNKSAAWWAVLKPETTL